MLLTTKKDSISLPQEAATVLAPLGLYWLRIRLAVEPEEALVEILQKQLG